MRQTRYRNKSLKPPRKLHRSDETVLQAVILWREAHWSIFPSWLACSYWWHRMSAVWTNYPTLLPYHILHSFCYQAQVTAIKVDEALIMLSGSCVDVWQVISCFFPGVQWICKKATVDTCHSKACRRPTIWGQSPERWLSLFRCSECRLQGESLRLKQHLELSRTQWTAVLAYWSIHHVWYKTSQNIEWHLQRKPHPQSCMQLLVLVV